MLAAFICRARPTSCQGENVPCQAKAITSYEPVPALQRLAVTMAFSQSCLTFLVLLTLRGEKQKIDGLRLRDEFADSMMG
jgi:hypothetical protein